MTLLEHAQQTNVVLFALLVMTALGWAATPICTHHEQRKREEAQERKERQEKAEAADHRWHLRQNFIQPGCRLCDLRKPPAPDDEG